MTDTTTNTETPTVHFAPDLRRQSLHDAEEHLQRKRVRRLVLLHTEREKLVEKATKAGAVEKEKFDKLLAQFDKKMTKIDEEFSRAETILRKMHETNHSLSNIETTLRDG